MRRLACRLLMGFSVLALAGCGGGGGGSVASTPTPAPLPPASPPPPPPASGFDTAEFQRSNAAVQAQALAAYNAGASGAGVLVGVIDSGVDATSAEFTGRISALSGDFAGTRGLGDDSGHGTAVADILLGAKNDSGVQGVAFGATLLALRTDTPGSCTGTSTTGSSCSHNDNAIALALDAATAARARVVNISLGGAPPNSNLFAAIDRATAAGTIIVISAGNQGVTDPAIAVDPDFLAQVARDPIARGLVVIAGATDSSGALASFSNRAGNSAANYLAALGVRVQSVDQNGRATLYTGTSFSAPVISGAIALLAQAFPTLTPAQIVALLYRSADDRGAAGVDAIYGNGELNIARAFSPIGQLSLASAAVPVSLTNNATLGAAMGDAGQGPLGTTIRDEFGRDFKVDLGATIAHSAAPPLLAGRLSSLGRGLVAADGRSSYALTIDDTQGPQPLTLRTAEERQARVLAGALTVALSRKLQLGLGGGVAAEALLPQAASPAFLVSDRALDRAPVAAIAVRRESGRLAVTVSAETGDMRLWQLGESGPGSDGMRRYAYSQTALAVGGTLGRLSLVATMTQLDERATVLGSRFGPALGGSGAVSRFGTVDVSLGLGSGWQVGATFEQGWTDLAANIVRNRSLVTTRALSASLGGSGLLVPGDRLALRFLEPLRVTGGGLDLRALGENAPYLSLMPSGRERDWEASYSRALGTGWLHANVFLRQQPTNRALAPDDIGAAVRYRFNF